MVFYQFFVIAWLLYALLSAGGAAFPAFKKRINNLLAIAIVWTGKKGLESRAAQP